MAIGQGENGKDTLRAAISQIHGRSSIATIGISDWQQYEAGSGRGRFSIASLDRARLSIASENSGSFKIDNLQNLKAAITGDPLFVERKSLDGTDIIPRAVFLFFLNQSPLLDGGSAAILSRWAVVNMPHSYSTTPKPGQLKADPRFKHDPEWLATEVLPALLNLMLEALANVAANGFSLDGCAADLQQLREDTSHLHQFLRDCGYVVAGPTDHVDLKQLWADLQGWYQTEGWTQYNRAGDLEHVETGDGDKPVKAIRLLPKRLTLLNPSIRKQRESGQARNTLIYGLTQIGPNHGAKTDPVANGESL
jgi:putative DNA primase/helicase